MSSAYESTDWRLSQTEGYAIACAVISVWGMFGYHMDVDRH